MILLKRVDIDLEAVRHGVRTCDYSPEEQHALLALYAEFEVGDFKACVHRIRPWSCEWREFVDQSVWAIIHATACGEVYLTTEQIRDPDKGWV